MTLDTILHKLSLNTVISISKINELKLILNKFYFIIGLRQCQNSDNQPPSLLSLAIPPPQLMNLRVQTPQNKLALIKEK
jgi:hypothetical protein